ncbi:hypothetical protein [Listeria cornellensis]|uniref:LXG domain-containing protein n=1 Tax=Listeria cornellensis FSL F6-0969 TaxID=1265820 RepID=W7BRJ5_9LIST|nr:hypothetical protein [Listeria cornellensis]EUJ27305.1 hypothetical protein PCORN_13277 [Listeria cornellensis FSL F6-0969]
MDFKINMGELEETLTSLHKMKASLETLDGVLLNVQDVAAQQKGKLAEALAMEFGAHRDDISRQQGTVTKLFTYLENYVNDFKDIDSPTYRNQDMLIDARGLQKAAEMQGYALDDAKSEVFRVPQPSIESIPDDPDELWVMRHNQGLMEELDDYLRRKLTQLQQNEGEAMQRISQDMRKLLEMDQHHASIIEADYRHYDRNKVREIGASAIDTVIGFGLGAMDSLKHPEKHLESIAMLMKNLRTDPSGTAGMLWDGVVASYLEPYNKGDAYGLASSTIFFASTFGITKGLIEFGRVKDVAGSPRIISKYDDIASYEFNGMNPGPLAMLDNKPNTNFYGGRYNVKVLKEDTVLYRGGKQGGLTVPGQEKNGLGEWFTTAPPDSVAKVRIDSAVKYHWIKPQTGKLTGTSIIDAVYEVRIPKGTTIYEGPVGYQGGHYLGGLDNFQIYITRPWELNNVQVISESTLK